MLIGSLFVLGFCALIFQVVFAKHLIFVFGLTAPAIATVLAVYFAGLALGGFVFGKWADRGRPVRLYALIFLVLGAYGLLFPQIFKLLNWLILAINGVYPLSFAGFNFFAFALSFVFLLLPSVCVGGGLPILSKVFITKSEAVGSRVSLLYFVETFGSVLGAAAVGFWLLPSFGSSSTLFFTSLGVLIIGGLLLLVRPQESLAIAHEQTKLKKIFVLALFLTGFFALALEIVYTKTLILFIGSSTYAFSLILAAFLFGIALGSFAASFFIQRITRGMLWFGILVGGTGVWLLVTMKYFEKLPFWYLQIFNSFGSFEFSAILSAQLVLTFLVIFPAAFFMGITFPLGIKLAAPQLGKIGQSVGKLYFSNTLGGVAGSLLAGFVVLPIFGFQKTLLFILAGYLLLAGLFILKAETRLFIKGGLIGVLVLVGFLGGTVAPWSEVVLSLGPFAYADIYPKSESEIRDTLADIDTTLFYKEGLSQVNVTEREGKIFLRVNGKTDAGTGENDTERAVLSGVLPMMLHENPKEVLVIGLGGGITLGSITQFEEPERIDVVEIDPNVVKAADYFKAYNYDALADPRVRVSLADGRNYLYLNDRKYDVISSEPSNPWVSGNAYLFTKEYYELARSRLKQGGLMMQWIHTYNLEVDDVRAVLRTFAEVFPRMYVFEQMRGGNIFMVGGESNIRFEAVEQKFANPDVAAEMLRINIADAYEFVSNLIATEKEVRAFTKNAALHTDDNTFLEFSAPKTIYQDTTLEAMQDASALRKSTGSPYAIVGGDRDKLERYFSFREMLVPFRLATQEGGDLDEAERLCREMVKLGVPTTHPAISYLFIDRCYE